VADAAVGNRDFNFLPTQLAWVITKREKFRPSSMNCQTLNLSHGSSVFLYGIK
jgi:hypothetical protein